LNNFIKPDKIYLSIVLPFKITNQNADIIRGNKYTWTINQDNEPRSIDLVYDKSKKSDTLYIGTFGVKYTVVIISVLLVLLLSFILIVREISRANRKI
jgi:hypothetical protein